MTGRNKRIRREMGRKTSTDEEGDGGREMGRKKSTDKGREGRGERERCWEKR